MALSLEELLNQEELKTPYYWDGILPKGGRMIIGAPAKSLKSMLTLNWIYDLAGGKDPLNKSEIKPPKILYIEQEIGDTRLRERLQKIHASKGLGEALHNLYLQPKDPQFKLFKPQLIRLIRDLKPNIIVLDPLRKFHAMSENSADEMAQVMQEIERLQAIATDNQPEETSCIYVHHTGKRNEYHDNKGADSLRGSSFIFDDVDTLAMIERKGKQWLKINWTTRSSEEPDPLELRMDDQLIFTQTKNQESNPGKGVSQSLLKGLQENKKDISSTFSKVPFS